MERARRERRAGGARGGRARLGLFVGLASLALIALVGVCVARALLASPREVAVPPPLELELEPLGLTRRLAAALRIPTVATHDPDALEEARFEELLAHLERSFPRAHDVMDVERPAGRALLMTWTGSDASASPVVLCAHLDVVPVERGTEEAWPAPPFAGELVGGALVGRGALDDKSAAMALLEAAEEHLRHGFVPARTVLFAFGMDEEIGGARGAAAIASLLEERGVRPTFVLDEGLFVLEGFLDGIARPVCAIGLAEKGAALVRLTARGEGGHSSMPPEHTAVGRVARAVARLEAAPMPAAIDPPASLLFEALLADFPFVQRLALANTWLTEPLVTSKLARAASTNALLRTTAAATVIEGGDYEGALPASASALINFRLHPRDTVEAVLEHARAAIDDAGIELELLGAEPPSPISPAEGPAWELLERTALQVFPDARVAPALCIAGTDGRHYARLTPHVYRFLPLRLTPAEAERIHGTGERIPLSSYLEMVRFYAQLLANLR